MKNLDLANFGYSLIVADKTKRPLGAWTKNRTEAFNTPDILKKLKHPDAAFLGLVCGYNNVEIIDVDLKFILGDDIRNKFLDGLLTELKNTIPDFEKKTIIVKTISGGRHIIYRNEKREYCDGNKKLAKLKEHTEYVIETRGEGGYAAIYDIDGNDYSFLKTLAPISKEEKDKIFAVCRSFNEEPVKETIKKTNFKAVSQWTKGITPWDDYNAKTDIWELIKDGFTIVSEGSKKTAILRNGSNALHSGYIFKNKNTLFLFTGNSPRIEAETLYTPFMIYSAFNFDGDYSRAAKSLHAMGFGDRGNFTKEITDFNNLELITNEKPSEDDDPIDNVGRWLKNYVKLKRNEITRRIIYQETNEILTEGKIKTLYLLAQKIDKKISYRNFDALVTGDNDIVPTFNPFKEFIKQNEGITTNNELEALKQTIKTRKGAEVDAHLWIEKWYLGLFAAIDGKPVRNVLALLGGQNTGKTEWFRRLLPDDLLNYYGESKLDREKDDELLMCEKLIINDDEMGGKSREDEKKFKMLTSKAVFSLRPPYQATNEDFKRLAVLCGTSNDLQVINDPTGNTRILPIEVIKIDHDAFNRIDKTRLFIDGFKKYSQDKNAFLLNDEQLKRLTIAGSNNEQINIEMELLNRYFDAPDGFSNVEYMTATEIKEYIEKETSKEVDTTTGYIRNNGGSKIVNMKNFGICLRRKFGEQITKYSKKTGNSIKVYEVSKIVNYRDYYSNKTE